MKFLASALAIVCILGDYRTILAEPADEHKEIVEFKKYAIEFVNAALQPLRDDRKTAEGTCECIPIFEQELSDHPAYVVLAIMSIAKDYYEDFQLVRRTSESHLSSIMPIKAELMENIHTILSILRWPVDDYPAFRTGDIVRKYITKTQRDPSIGINRYNRSLESALECYRSMYCLTAKPFYGKLMAGLKSISALLVADYEGVNRESTRKQLWDGLNGATEEIRGCELRTVPDPSDVDLVVRTFRESSN